MDYTEIRLMDYTEIRLTDYTDNSKNQFRGL